MGTLNDLGTGTLKATTDTWTVTGSNAGSLTNGALGFTGMANLTDLGAGTFNLSASAAAMTGTLTSTGGSVTLGDGGEVAGNVNMNSAGALHMGTAGTVGGTVIPRRWTTVATAWR